MGKPSVSWPAGGTRQSRAVREAVLLRDGYRCRVRAFRLGEYSHPQLVPAEAYRAILTVSQNCMGDDGSRLHAHHIRGRSVTGDDPAWVITACVYCNAANGNPAAGDPEPRCVTRW